ncbi:MAG: hypothetical protein U0T68_08560 [Ferruginibacter sp.]
MQLQKGSLANYLIMFIVLGISGMPFFSSNQPFTILFALGLIGLFMFSHFKKIDEEFLYVAGAIIACVIFQAVTFSFFKGITIMGLIMRILTAYLAIRLIGQHYVTYFVRVMVVLSIISLIIFIPIMIKPDLMQTLKDATPAFMSYKYELWGMEIDRKTLIVYNFVEEIDRLRNNGPFWEPGAFGGYLVIVYMLNTIREARLLGPINILFIVTILTTQSTTAYLALFAFIVFYIFFEDYSYATKSLIIVFGVAGYIAFQTIPFLGDKIKEENAGAKDAIETVGGDTRMASAILDWEDIKGYPLAGRGIWDETRVDKKFQYAIRNNGFTNFIAQWGILFFLFYFYWYYRGFSEFCRIYGGNAFIPIVLILVIWLLSFSENYFDSPFFWSLVFLSIPLREVEAEEDEDDDGEDDSESDEDEDDNE